MSSWNAWSSQESSQRKYPTQSQWQSYVNSADNQFEFDDKIAINTAHVSTAFSGTWTPEEDKHLCYCWAHYSTDSIHGNDQSKGVFWGKVLKAYNKKFPSRERTEKAIMGRFGKINRQTQFYESQIFKIKQANPSGIGGEFDLV